MIARSLRGGVVALTPTTILMAAVLAYAQETSQFNLLEALKGNKPDEEGQTNKEPKSDGSVPEAVKRANSLVTGSEVEPPPITSLGVGLKENPNLLPLGPQLNGEVTPDVKIMVGDLKPKVHELSYHTAYLDAQKAELPLAVFMVRTEDPNVIRFINSAVTRFQAAGFQQWLGIAVIGPQNPNMLAFDELDSEIEMKAWYRRDGKLKTNNYVGLKAVEGICDRMHDWLGKKRRYQDWLDQQAGVQELKIQPRSFQLIKPLNLVR